MQNAMSSWRTFTNVSIKADGEESGKHLFNDYLFPYLPAPYREDSHPIAAVLDIERYVSLGE